MGKAADNIFFSEGFGGLANSANRMDVCSQQPTTYTEATSTYSLGNVTLDSGDYTEGDASPDGRKVTIGAQTITGGSNGTGTHIVLTETGQSQLWYVTTCTSVGISTGVDQDFSAWDIVVRDPT